MGLRRLLEACCRRQHGWRFQETVLYCHDEADQPFLVCGSPEEGLGSQSQDLQPGRPLLHSPPTLSVVGCTGEMLPPRVVVNSQCLAATMGSLVSMCRSCFRVRSVSLPSAKLRSPASS